MTPDSRPSKDRSAGPGEVALPAELEIAQASALHALLLPHLEAPALRLSAAAVDRVHTAGLQVLAAFVRTRGQAGRATAWHEPSAPLCRAAATLGLSALLGLPATA